MRTEDAFAGCSRRGCRGRRALFGGALGGSTSARHREPRPAAAADAARSTASRAGDTAALVAQLEAAGRANPSDVRSLDAPRARLPAARTRDRRSQLLPEVRGGAAPRARARAEDAARDERARLARALAPSLRGGARARPSARARSPRRAARSYGVIGDALVELGRYREAFAALRPDGLPQARPAVVRAHLATRASCSAATRRRSRR